MLVKEGIQQSVKCLLGFFTADTCSTVCFKMDANRKDSIQGDKTP